MSRTTIVGAAAGGAAAAAPPPLAALARGGGGAPAVDGGLGRGRSHDDRRVGCADVPRR